ncbi:mannose-6-phosphate isomerase, class I [Phytophthora nicotianae CJ01A1]|uniref:mannose-6-phosphate isomerase n=6 Tax=Phytophthora nicotianae TaxID=4792 RepID=W2PZD5_PHYN3|nr:mannose-6-phosphate isomerase, class I [Phytophthora nicotianae INRA-310]ETI42461.1 mannose-6-phosphate isomerase, class I [Phytophthora nicotianae P1569]ETK82477.1 mannose-6-phosphate isomerase, class I [Phytophthora nicotianae]ETO71080.1 mannose-6-phosphate isomerase, class I [Phytophthora nicotianae P1976]ETP12174.1 mannose-6-phosphate isomerase, class I [Phytophthora nicotianae CJ01A1]ETP40301.1 mannose-6-phosphate isomerase, class I [Phytophthora nicotianae P10297]KUF88853.1 Mannose-6
MQELQCVAQTYAWGKSGLESSVAQLKEAADESFKADAATPYAELWMGTHPNGPSKVLREENKDALLLSDWIRMLRANETGDLPYLFKVLSVRKALSIQAHPDIKLARELHEKFPEIYKDANHKPEMTIALTRFEALCQFREINEIAAHLHAVPELCALVDAEVSQRLMTQQDEAALREFFRCFVYAESSIIVAQLRSLRARLESSSSLSALEKLVLRLDNEYPGDIGCFCPFLLNYITLEPGEAMFLGANEPHAYLFGDCVECMACSDNVVRAGLTPKFIDKETLHSMLTYYTGKPRVYKGDVQSDGVTRLYSSPVPEFEVEAVELKPRQRYALPARKGDSIVLVISGGGSTVEPSGNADGRKMSKGKVYFLPKGEILEIQGGEDGILAFRASPNESLISQKA